MKTVSWLRAAVATIDAETGGIGIARRSRRYGLIAAVLSD